MLGRTNMSEGETWMVQGIKNCLLPGAVWEQNPH